MSTGIQNLLSSNSYRQQLLSVTPTSANGVSSSLASSLASGVTGDSNQLSPFAQIVSTLQQLQESNPSEYQQVTQKIATNLQSAAQQAQSEGNSTGATQLGQLATDFTNASSSGQLPNLQDLAQAVQSGGGHHRHHHAASSDGSDSSSSGSSAGASSSSNSGVSQFLAALQGSGTGSSEDSLNPLNIIADTLQNAGIGG